MVAYINEIDETLQLIHPSKGVICLVSQQMHVNQHLLQVTILVRLRTIHVRILRNSSIKNKQKLDKDSFS